MNTKLELLLGTSSTCLPVIQTSSALSLCVDGPEGFSPDPGFLPDAALSVRLSLFGSMEVLQVLEFQRCTVKRFVLMQSFEQTHQSNDMS